MVSHPKTPILNCFYHVLWFYFSTVSELSCLAKSFSVLHWIPKLFIDSIHILFLPYLLLGFGFSTSKPAGFHQNI